jgi:DNA-binding transcriptional ArsR family regulator
MFSVKIIMNGYKHYEVIKVSLDIDVKQTDYKISVQISKVAELLAAVHLLAHKNHHSFDEDWVKYVLDSISHDSMVLLDKLSNLNFPGLELFDFITKEGIYDDIPLFISKLRQYSDLDFLHTLLDEQISKELLMSVQQNEIELNSLSNQIPWVLKGSESFINYIFYHTAEYRIKTILLLEEIYNCNFVQKLESLQQRYEDSIEAVKQRLTGRNPVEVGEEIKGSKFSAKTHFKEYIFSPSYFFHHHNIISYNENTYLMIFNINIDNSFEDGEAERLSDLLKVLSDKTRLEILRQLKRRPTYGKVLSTRLNLTTATISRHLDQLKAINMIKEDKSSNVKYYFVNSDEVEKLFDEIRKFISKK